MKNSELALIKPHSFHASDNANDQAGADYLVSQCSAIADLLMQQPLGTAVETTDGLFLLAPVTAGHLRLISASMVTEAGEVIDPRPLEYVLQLDADSYRDIGTDLWARANCTDAYIKLDFELIERRFPVDLDYLISNEH